MAEEFKDMGAAVAHIEKKMEEFKTATTKEAQDAALKEVKGLLEKTDTETKKAFADLQLVLEKKDATIAQIQEEFKELKMKGGRIKGVGLKILDQPSWMVAQQIKQNVANVIEEKGMKLEMECKMTNPETAKQGIEIKTVADMSSANLTGDTYQSYLPWQLGMGPRGGIHFRDLVRTIQSATDYVQFPRENTPRGEGSFGRQTTEGSAKPKVDYDFTMVDVTLTPIAGYAITSRQALRNIPFLQSYLPETMMQDLLDTEDTDFGNKLVAAATGSATTTGITVAAERLIYFMKNQFNAKHKITAFVVDPSVWAALLVFRPGTDNPYGLPSVTTIDPSGNIRVMGVPIIPVSWLTGGRIIAGDWSRAAIVESEGLQFRQSDSHASTFIQNQLTFLLERTEELAVFRPEAFITTTLS